MLQGAFFHEGLGIRTRGFRKGREELSRAWRGAVPQGGVPQREHRTEHIIIYKGPLKEAYRKANLDDIRTTLSAGVMEELRVEARGSGGHRGRRSNNYSRFRE